MKNKSAIIQQLYAEPSQSFIPICDYSYAGQGYSSQYVDDNEDDNNGDPRHNYPRGRGFDFWMSIFICGARRLCTLYKQEKYSFLYTFLQSSCVGRPNKDRLVLWQQILGTNFIVQ